MVGRDTIAYLLKGTTYKSKYRLEIYFRKVNSVYINKKYLIHSLILLDQSLCLKRNCYILVILSRYCCILSTWLLLIFRRVTHWAWFVSGFRLTWIGVIILNGFVGLLRGNFTVFCQTMFLARINLDVYMSTIRPCNENCCHILCRATDISRDFQQHLRNLFHFLSAIIAHWFQSLSYPTIPVTFPVPMIFQKYIQGIFFINYSLVNRRNSTDLLQWQIGLIVLQLKMI